MTPKTELVDPTNAVMRELIKPEYHPESCCACRWVVWGEDCGHPESDGIESPHDHCERHDGR